MGNMIEVDEAELASLKNVAGLFNKTMNSKEREKLLRALKGANPELPIPEIDAKEPVMEELASFSKSLKEMKESLEADKASREEEKRLAKLQAEWGKSQQKAIKAGYVGDSLEALEKFMEEKGVADHEIAMAAFEKMNPPATPISSTSSRFDLFAPPSGANDVLGKNIEALKEGKITDSQYIDSSVNAVLKEMRGFAA